LSDGWRILGRANPIQPLGHSYGNDEQNASGEEQS
jgi:hypothetical protein